MNEKASFHWWNDLIHGVEEKGRNQGWKNQRSTKKLSTFPKLLKNKQNSKTFQGLQGFQKLLDILVKD